jgi:hypothetical protein
VTLVFTAEAIGGGERYRGGVRSRLAARLVTGPLAFLVAGVLDATAAWGRWAADSLAARVARRFAG